METTQGQPNFMGTLSILPIFLFIFYFFVIKPQQDKEKKRKTTISELKKGDKIMTSGGIYGQIADVKEDKFVVKISKEIKIEISKEHTFPFLDHQKTK